MNSSPSCARRYTLRHRQFRWLWTRSSRRFRHAEQMSRLGYCVFPRSYTLVVVSRRPSRDVAVLSLPGGRCRDRVEKRVSSVLPGRAGATGALHGGAGAERVIRVVMLFITGSAGRHLQLNGPAACHAHGTVESAELTPRSHCRRGMTVPHHAPRPWILIAVMDSGGIQSCCHVCVHRVERLQLPYKRIAGARSTSERDREGCARVRQPLAAIADASGFALVSSDDLQRLLPGSRGLGRRRTSTQVAVAGGWTRGLVHRHADRPRQHCSSWDRAGSAQPGAPVSSTVRHHERSLHRDFGATSTSYMAQRQLMTRLHRSFTAA